MKLYGICKDSGSTSTSLYMMEYSGLLVCMAEQLNTRDPHVVLNVMCDILIQTCSNKLSLPQMVSKSPQPGSSLRQFYKVEPMK